MWSLVMFRVIFQRHSGGVLKLWFKFWFCFSWVCASPTPHGSRKPRPVYKLVLNDENSTSTPWFEIILDKKYLHFCMLPCFKWTLAEAKIGWSKTKAYIKLYKQLTLSAMVRPSLSILEPASAIFLAALMTSDVFFSGPLPLKKTEQKYQSEILI